MRFRIAPPVSAHRVVWLYALGFLFFYTPYASLSKAISSGLVPGVPKGLVGLEILPAAILGTVLTVPLIITLVGWWKHASIPTPAIALSGLGLAMIIGSTTVAFTFKGISIVLALLLMRGGLLIMGPIVDLVYGRRVRWFSWAALVISFLALFVSFAATKDFSLPLLAAANLAVYLTGYALRTPCMTKLAKVTDPEVTRCYFVQEVLVTIVLLPLIPFVVAFAGNGETSLALRHGFTSFWSMHTAAVWPIVLIGVFYASHNIFGTLIYLDRRENTFTVPLFCGASFLAGFLAVSLLWKFAGLAAPPTSQLISSAMFLSALLLLSPAHHHVENAWAFLRGRRLRSVALASPSHFILFVCSGNTCRSPMAAAIANAEIELRLNALRGARAESAGLDPRLGSGLDDSSRAALAALSIAAPAHEARTITREQIDAAQVIYCMTEVQRTTLVQRFPEAAAKTRCLDANGDIPEPTGQPAAVYTEVARRIQTLVRHHFDEAFV